MSENQIQTKQRASPVEPRDTASWLGEPGIANQKTPVGMPWESDHPVNLRLTIPFFKRRCYITLVAGTERRSPERLAAERLNHPIRTKGNLAFLLAAGTIVGAALFTIVQLVGNWVLAQTGWVQL